MNRYVLTYIVGMLLTAFLIVWAFRHGEKPMDDNDVMAAAVTVCFWPLVAALVVLYAIGSLLRLLVSL